MIANILKIIILGKHKICIDEKSFLARNEYQAMVQIFVPRILRKISMKK